jgi:Ca2+-binding RTX toxin-like protein
MLSSSLFRRVLETGSLADRRAKTRRPRLAIQELENRSLLAASLMASLDVADGILRVEGTEDSDLIRVVQTDGSIAVEGITISVTDADGNVSDVDFVDSSLIGSVQVEALSGDDTVVLDDAGRGDFPPVPAHMFGGDGNDTIVGGQAGDQLTGGGTAGHGLAFTLDRDLGLYSTGEENLNWGGLDEKWLAGNDGWYFITPDGALTRWDGSEAATGELIANLQPIHYEQLGKLVDAAQETDNDVLTGGDGGDSLFGGDDSDQLFGEAGNDFLYGAHGTDGYEEGANTNDALDGGVGYDYLYGGLGNDTLGGGSGSDWLRGQLGNDLMFGGTDINGVETGDANDTLWGGKGNDTVYGGYGHDSIIGEDGSDVLDGQWGNDFIYGATDINGVETGEMNDTLWGGNGNDTLYGGYGDDRLVGENGYDELHGQWGNDLVVGSNWNKATSRPVTTEGGTDNRDVLYGENGNDKLYGGDGDDQLNGGWDNDELYGDGGNDKLYGASSTGAAERAGSTNRDTLFGGAGLDQLSGGDDNDLLYGEGDADTLSGGIGNDSLYGGSGNDSLDGQDNDDTLDGQSDNDTLIGNTGIDRIAVGQLGDLILQDSFRLSGPAVQRWLELGGEAGFLGAATTAVVTSADKVGQYVHFKGGSMYWHPAAGAHVVYGAIRDKWVALGAERGRLGYPTSDEFTTTNGWRMVSFQAGSIVWRSDVGARLSFVRDEMLRLFDRIGQDGVVDAAEMTFLKSIVSDLTVHMPAEVRNLANKLVNGDAANAEDNGLNGPQPLGNLMVGSSRDQLQRLVAKWFRGTDWPTALDNLGYRIPYGKAEGDLFGPAGPQISDIDQGATGDCYFLASLGAVLNRNPQAIRDMFVDNKDGTFTVRFYRMGLDFVTVAGQPEYVTVDRWLPVGRFGFVYANGGTASLSSEKNVLWAALAEKAYAQLNQSGWIGQDGTNSYAGIDAGQPSSALSHITGRKADWIGMTFGILTMRESFRAGNSIVLSSYSKGDLKSNLIVGTHAYTLVSVRDDNTFVIYNPWGSDGQGADDGFIVLSYSEILDNFRAYSRGA